MKYSSILLILWLDFSDLIAFRNSYPLSAALNIFTNTIANFQQYGTLAFLILLKLSIAQNES